MAGPDGLGLRNSPNTGKAAEACSKTEEAVRVDDTKIAR